jgi:hypothetical protein
LVQTDEERRAKKKEYRLSEKGKAKIKEYSQRPEVKARQKKREHDLKFEINKRRRSNYQKPEVKAKKREYYQRPEVKARKKAYSEVYHKEYNQKPEVKAKKREYDLKPKIIARKSKKYDNARLKVLQVYSKRLSNSDIPCCKCCNLNSHIEFLAIDHIEGRMEMDSIPELVKIGYSSKFSTGQLIQWITKNNFPEGFQTLCHNCNMAKGFYGKCFHEIK